MISNKTITIAAVGFAYANAVTLQAKLGAQVESENILKDFGAWSEGAFNSAVSWGKGAVNDAVSWGD